MEVSNEHLVGSWIVSNNITNSLSIAGRRARIYLMSMNEKSELVDIFSFEVAPKKPTHKSIHIHNPTIVVCP
jgi:hypothetical protein